MRRHTQDMSLNAISIDCATETLSICLQAHKAFWSFAKTAGLMHAQSVAPWIEKLCDDAGICPADLDLIVAGIGPGSFTGLRIGLATAKGLALGASCSIVGVSGLDSFGWKLKSFHGVVVPVIDAKKNRLYSALYQKGQRISDYLDVSEDNLLSILSTESEKEILLTGPYAHRFYERISQGKVKAAFSLDPLYNSINPCIMLELGLERLASTGDQGDSVMPLYLRKSEAEIKRENKR